jgi:hypothetical protein
MPEINLLWYEGRSFIECRWLKQICPFDQFTILLLHHVQGQRLVIQHASSYPDKNSFVIAAAATLMIGGVGATAAELPSYEVAGFPITPHQFVVLGPANAQERAPAAALTLAGMPASPHQIAVLTPRRRVITGQIAGPSDDKATP